MSSAVCKTLAMWLVATVVLVLFLASCAPLPKIPGIVCVPEQELRRVMEEYTQQCDQLKELKELQEWKDQMFF